jgi:hypothetical protein
MICPIASKTSRLRMSCPIASSGISTHPSPGSAAKRWDTRSTTTARPPPFSLPFASQGSTTQPGLGETCPSRNHQPKESRIFLYPNDDWPPRMEEDRFEHSVFKILESQTLYRGDGRKGRWLQESIPNHGFGNSEGVRMGELHDYIHSMADATTGEVGATARVIITERTRLSRSMHFTENPSCWWMVEDGRWQGGRQWRSRSHMASNGPRRSIPPLLERRCTTR